MAKATKQTVAVIEQQTPEQLHESLVAQQTDLLGYKKGLAAGELKNTGVIKATRKEIARIKTALSASKVSKEGDN